MRNGQGEVVTNVVDMAQNRFSLFQHSATVGSNGKCVTAKVHEFGQVLAFGLVHSRCELDSVAAVSSSCTCGARTGGGEHRTRWRFTRSIRFAFACGAAGGASMHLFGELAAAQRWNLQ